MRPREFDVGEFARTARASLRDELDLTSFGTSPVAPDIVVVLGVLGDLEGATMAHLRNVLVTPTHKDARVTAFLVTWAFEKFWIADALAAIIAANGGGASSGSLADVPAAPRRGIRHGPGPVRRAFGGFAQGESVVGAHTTMGLVDDWVLREAYESVSSQAAGSTLADALATILAVKARHTAFFEEESRRRLAASPSAARLARRELRRSPWPLGAAAIDPKGRGALSRFAWSGADGAERLSSLERGIAELPGIGTSAASVVRATLARDASD